MSDQSPAATPPASSPGEPILDVEGVEMRYGDGPAVLRDLSFSVRPGEFVCIVGPSGCGKTTLLRLLAGLVQPIVGSVKVESKPLSDPHPDVAVVFQDYARALAPWRTARRNVELPLEGRVGRGERRDRAIEALERVGLGDKADAFPGEMSGGMQQRLQIARALVQNPRLLLMDEPFASVDALTKFHLEDTTLELWRDFDQTVILVTHDLDEAVYLADRVLVLDVGPAHVVAELAVHLERPRDQADTRAHPEFVELRHELFERIRSIETAVGARRPAGTATP